MLFSRIKYLILTLSFIACFGHTTFAQPTGSDRQPAYDAARIYKAMAKAQRGESIVIGVIGGSITMGSAASSVSKRWANLMTDWWKTKFPLSNVTLVNAGIGATGSGIGAHRIQADLLSKNPDFVVVEFSVNDAYDIVSSQTMEGLMRQILVADNHPGVMMLILKQQNGASSLYYHKPVALNYHIPYISYAEWIGSKIAQDGVSLASLYSDGLHPVDLGMRYISGFITEELDSIYAHLPADSLLPAIDTNLPAAKFSDVFENTYVYNNTSLISIVNTGWENSNTGWVSSTPNSKLDFEVFGNAISFLYTRHNTSNRGYVEMWIDDGAHQIFDAYWSATWGPATIFALIAENLDSGKHIVHANILSYHNYNSTGNFFEIKNILTAGNITPDFTVGSTATKPDFTIKVFPSAIKSSLQVLYSVPQSSKVTISIVSFTGQYLAAIASKSVEAGSHSEQIDTHQLGLARGMYLMVMKVNGKTVASKFMVE